MFVKLLKSVFERLLHEVALAFQFFLNILQGSDLGLGFLKVQAVGVVGVELLYLRTLRVALLEELVVVQSAVVSGYTVEVAHILGLGALLLGEQCLIHLLSVADADDFDILLLASEELANGLGLGLDRASRGFLYEDVTVVSMLESEKDEIDGLLQRHDEAGHLGLGQRDGVAIANLVYPQGNDRTTGTHHIAIARAADLGIARVATLGDGDLLLHGLGDTHGVDGIGGLVGGEADDGTYASLDGSSQDIVRADDIGLDGLHREELTARDLLQCCGMKDVIHTRHGVAARLQVTYITDKELDLVCHIGVFHLILVAHIVLLLLIAGEDADFSDVCTEETVQHCVTEGSCSTGYHKSFTCKNAHNILCLFLFCAIILSYHSAKCINSSLKLLLGFLKKSCS